MVLYNAGEKIEFDTVPYMYNDPYFIQAFDEIKKILDGRNHLSMTLRILPAEKIIAIYL